MEVKEKLGWTAEWNLHRFRDPTGEIAAFLQGGGKLEEAMDRWPQAFISNEQWFGNLGLQEGRAELIDIICGLGTPTKWDNSNARLGVGDSNTAPADTQTGLQAASNKNIQGYGCNLSATVSADCGVAVYFWVLRRKLRVGRIYRCECSRRFRQKPEPLHI
jgi:hypothetical protein